MALLYIIFKELLHFTGEIIRASQQTKTLIFRSTNVQTSCNLVPTEHIFKRTYTKLNIQLSVHPGDRETQAEILRQRQMILHGHSGHNPSQLKIKNHTSFSYLVGDNNAIPFLCKPVFYYTFAILGLSLPYRWCVYLSVGHVKFNIKKRVFQGQAITPEVERLPLPPTVPLIQEGDSPPDYAACTRPETPPPDYDTVCGVEPLKAIL